MRLSTICLVILVLFTHSILASPDMSFNKGPDPYAKLFMMMGMGPGAAPTRPELGSEETLINATEEEECSEC